MTLLSNRSIYLGSFNTSLCTWQTWTNTLFWLAGKCGGYEYLGNFSFRSCRANSCCSLSQVDAIWRKLWGPLWLTAVAFRQAISKSKKNEREITLWPQERGKFVKQVAILFFVQAILFAFGWICLHSKPLNRNVKTHHSEACKYSNL